MSTATKTRRVVPITPKGMATPKRKNKGAQAAVLANFDLEVEHRTRDMRTNLENALGAFMAHVDADLLKIPRAMLSMTLGEIEACWAGSFAETHMALAKRQFSRAHPERDEADVVAAAKRKRAQSPHSTPSRSTKNARKTPAGTPAATTGKRRATSKRTKPVLPPSASSSTLPQDHIFNPLLPKTPKLPRAPRRNESFFSANGSPVAVDDEVSDVESEDSDELPDPEAMERRALSVTPLSSASTSASSRRKPKRAPSLILRQTMPRETVASDVEEAEYAKLHLSTGHTIMFDPHNLAPGQVDRELAEAGVPPAECKRVKADVQVIVMKALQKRMEVWTID